MPELCINGYYKMCFPSFALRLQSSLCVVTYTYPFLCVCKYSIVLTPPILLKKYWPLEWVLA